MVTSPPRLSSSQQGSQVPPLVPFTTISPNSCTSNHSCNQESTRHRQLNFLAEYATVVNKFPSIASGSLILGCILPPAQLHAHHCRNFRRQLRRAVHVLLHILTYRRDKDSHFSFLRTRVEAGSLQNSFHSTTQQGLLPEKSLFNSTNATPEPLSPLSPINGPNPTVDFQKRIDFRWMSAVNFAGAPHTPLSEQSASSHERSL